jgi:enoyl-CoA hydratase/carnithine racemase
MAPEHVLTSVADHVAWLTINHPERHNAFDHETLEALAAAVSRCGDDASVGAIVITGAGDKAFCAGGYLGDLAASDLGRLRSLFFGMLEAANAIRRVRQPVIAAVNGYAMGGGNELVIACDFAVASDRAVFGQTGPRIGSSPVVGATNLLTLCIGEKRAKEVSMLCRRYTAEQALAMGWINEVVPHAELPGRVRAWCDEILALSPRYLEISKLSSNYWWDLLQPGFVQGLGMVWASAGSAEMLEGARAFMERRKPDFMQFRQAGKS